MESDERKDKHASKAKFKKLCLARFNLKKANAGERCKRLERGMAWDIVSMDVDARYPGESLTDYRWRIKQSIKAVAGSIHFSYRKMPQFDKDRFSSANLELATNVAQEAKDPTYVPQFACTEQFWVPERILQFASELAAGLDNHFVCRNEECLFFAPNTCWMQEYRPLTTDDARLYFQSLFDKAEPHKVVIDRTPPTKSELHHFLCSLCGTEYLPWQQKSHFIPANKIAVAAPAGDKQLAAAMGLGPNEGRYWYVQWTDTATSIMEARLKEISLQLVADTRGMTHGELHEHCVQQINQNAMRTHFDRHRVPESTLLKVNRRNSGADGDARKFRYNHLLEGFWAAKGPQFIRDGPVKTPVLTTDEFITNFAYTKTLCGIHTSQSNM